MAQRLKSKLMSDEIRSSKLLARFDVQEKKSPSLSPSRLVEQTIKVADAFSTFSYNFIEAAQFVDFVGPKHQRQANLKE